MSDRFKKLELQQTKATTSAEVAAQAGNPIRTAMTEFADAERMNRMGRFEPALQLYTRALGRDRALVPAWVGQVQMLVEMGEHHEARLWADKALELFRGNGDLLASRGRALLRLGDHREAVASSDMSLQAPGSSALRWMARGEILFARGQARARDCFDRAFAEKGADWFDRVRAARICLYHGKAAAAAEYARLAVDLDPGQFYAWYVSAMCHQNLGRIDAARTAYQRCIELSPRFEEAAGALRRLENEGAGSRFFRRMKGLFG